MTDVTLNFTQYFGQTKRYDVSLFSDAGVGGDGNERPVLGKPSWTVAPVDAPVGRIVTRSNDGAAVLIEAFDRPGMMVVQVAVPVRQPKPIDPNALVPRTTMFATLNIAVTDAPATDASVKPRVAQSAADPL